MLLFPIARFRKQRGKTHRVPPTPPAALSLVAAVYDENGPSLTLTFDRAIDISALVAGAIVVHDGNIVGERFVGDGPGVLISPAVVRISLGSDGSWPGNETTFTATAGTGIVAVDDGGTWSGVTDVETPFP